MSFTPISVFFNPLSKVYQAFSNIFSLTLINLIPFPTIHKPSTKNVNAKSMLYNSTSCSFRPLSKNINPFLKNVNAVSKIVYKKTDPFIPTQSKDLLVFVFIFKFSNSQIFKFVFYIPLVFPLASLPLASLPFFPLQSTKPTPRAPHFLCYVSSPKMFLNSWIFSIIE